MNVGSGSKPESLAFPPSIVPNPEPIVMPIEHPIQYSSLDWLGHSSGGKFVEVMASSPVLGG